MHERTNIHLSRSERSSLEAVVANRNSPQKHVWRAKIVLLTANGRGKAKTVIWRWQERFRDEGAAGLGGTRHGGRAFHRSALKLPNVWSP
jgi:hypothetical protein